MGIYKNGIIGSYKDGWDPYGYNTYYDSKGYDTRPIHEEEMKKKIQTKAKAPKKDDTLSESESLSKIRKACEGCTNDSACCAFVGLKKAGWTINISDGIDHEGRKGIVINMTEPVVKVSEPVVETGSFPVRRDLMTDGTLYSMDNKIIQYIDNAISSLYTEQD
jgi:hypothetical protein